MEKNIDLLAIAMAIGTAIYAALALDYLAIYQFGFSLQLVCRGATLVALLVGVFIAIEFLSGILSKSS